MLDDVIVAIATPVNNAGIGIIRVSGNGSIDLIDKIFVSAKNKKLVDIKSHTINYGHIVYEDSVIDEVLVSVMKAPNTFTREDVVEINCHGGAVVMRKILEIVLNIGARIAEPGEFTKRAFLNGRIDLSQAEAVIDIINAKTELSLKNYVGQLDGKISEKIEAVREKIIQIIAQIEAQIDYPEYDIENLQEDKLLISIASIIKDVDRLLKTCDNGKLISEGIRTAIIGKPNVGKSSLLNALLREQRAIVTDIAGTTRDIIEELISINGIPLKIIDTAGIRNTKDVVEKIGVEKAKGVINDADLVLFVVDSVKGIDDSDKAIIDEIQDKKVIVLLNKIDIGSNVNIEDIKKLINADIIEISAKENIGIEALEKKLITLFFNGEIKNNNDDIYITNARHKNALIKSINSLKLVIDAINEGMPTDCYSIDLKNAYEYLGEILGDSVDDSIINQIFSRFCLGK